jgi:P4 family phage/plasmid primase-like protien
MESKPIALPVVFEAIPLSIKKIPRFVMWKYVEIGKGDTKRWSKLPLQINHSAASSTDAATWIDYFTAEEAYKKGGFDGIGIVFIGEDNIIGIDLDDARDPNSGALTQFAHTVLDNVKGYAEVSPSGTGIKIFTRADLAYAHVDHSIGLEIYPKSRFFTVTGHIIGTSDLPEELQDLTKFVPARTINQSGDPLANYNPPMEGYDIARVESEILSKFNPKHGYDDWLEIGMCLHHQFSGSYEALEVWERWSFGDGSIVNYVQGATDEKWPTFKGQGVTLRTLIFKISQRNLKAALAKGEVVLDEKNPLNTAKRFLESFYDNEEGTRLVRYSDDFFVYELTHYRVIEEATVRSQLYRFLDKCKKQDRKGNVLPFNASAPAVNLVLDALKAVVHLQQNITARPPIWLEGYDVNRPPAEKLISLQNGLFHFEDAVLLPHTLGFFTENALQFSYDPAARCPTWLKFLNDLWHDDPESIALLQEYFGYILSGDTRQQKFLNLIGPRRSGKGTINKILVSLLGQHNIVSPQMEELVDTFGLQPWLGKVLASFTDARLIGRDSAGIVSQLLRIVGNDPITVNRKNRESWHGFLPTRIIVYSNEALQLQENSNALTGRMLVLQMTTSFFGREDITLSDKLSEELPGIFNWAMEGHARRLARPGERFVQPATGQETLDFIAELNNPLMEFMDDVLEFNKDVMTEKNEVFNCYKRWASQKNIKAGTEMAFKRRFISATQDLGVRTSVDRSNKVRRHVYIGIKLNDAAQKYIDTISNFESEEIFK